MLDKKEYYRDYYKKNKERYIFYVKKYQNSTKGKKKIKEWQKKNKEKRKEWRRNYERELRRKDPTISIKKKFLIRLRRVVKEYIKAGKIVEPKVHPTFMRINLNKLTEYERILIGIEGVDYKKIIEHLRPFPKDFLENYQVDHIIPLSKFNFNRAEDIKECFKPENHQILTIEQNQIKGNK